MLAGRDRDDFPCQIVEWLELRHEVEAEELKGARVVVTRPRRQAGPLIDSLVRRGAEPLPLPTIRIEPIDDMAQLDVAIDETRRGGFDWCVFTSANAVEVFANRMDALDVHPDQLASMRVAAVGRATAAAVAEAGLNLTLVPESATADALAARLRQVMGAGARVLYPRSAMGRDVLPNELRAAGFDVLAIDVYRTLPGAERRSAGTGPRPAGRGRRDYVRVAIERAASRRTSRNRNASP